MMDEHERTVPADPAVVFTFGAFEFDEALCELRREGKRVEVCPKSLRLLHYLLKTHDRMVSREELLEAIWPDVTVSQAALTSALRDLRRVLGGEEILATYRGLGLRFNVPVNERWWRPQGEPAAASPVPCTPRNSQFVGRRAEMQRLRAALSDALGGYGGLRFLVGDAGIGKSRTAEKLADEAGAQGARVYVGRCHEGASGEPLWPWTQVVRSCLQDINPRRLQLGTDTAAVLAAIGAASPATTFDTAGTPFALFEAIRTLLRTAAAERPLVLVLDDLHWADDLSLRCLAFVAETVSNTRMLVVGTCRDVEVSSAHPLIEMFGALARVPNSERIVLHGLERESMALLLTRGAARPLPEDVVDRVAQATAGNPFFVIEFALAFAAGPPHTTSLPLPERIRDAVRLRLARRSPGCREVLSLAAVMGREFTLEPLVAACDRARDAVLDALAEAEAAGLTMPVTASGLTYGFRHGLLGEVLANDLTAAERTRLSQRLSGIPTPRRGARPLTPVSGWQHRPPADRPAQHA